MLICMQPLSGVPDLNFWVQSRSITALIALMWHNSKMRAELVLLLYHCLPVMKLYIEHVVLGSYTANRGLPMGLNPEYYAAHTKPKH